MPSIRERQLPGKGEQAQTPALRLGDHEREYGNRTSMSPDGGLYNGLYLARDRAPSGAMVDQDLSEKISDIHVRSRTYGAPRVHGESAWWRLSGVLSGTALCASRSFKAHSQEMASADATLFTPPIW